MPDETEFEKLKKLYPDFFKGFPVKLMDLIISDETASQVSEICLKSGVAKDKTIEQVAYYITSVLLGNLPIKVFARALVTNLKIDTKTAEKIAEETNQIIFSRVKDDLAKLYGRETPLEGPRKPTPPPEEKLKKPPRKDTYREKIE